jgi:hypothetical protein
MAILWDSPNERVPGPTLTEQMWRLRVMQALVAERVGVPNAETVGKSVAEAVEDAEAGEPLPAAN